MDARTAVGQWVRLLSSVPLWFSPLAYFRIKLYLTMHRTADTPSRHVIFFPSSYVRPAYDTATS